jgi:hypothetical protein
MCEGGRREGDCDVGGWYAGVGEVPAVHAVKVLPIVAVNAGDLAFQFLIQGRPSHSGSKCGQCKALKRGWRDAASHKPDWTIADMQTKISGWKETHPGAAPQGADSSMKQEGDDDAPAPATSAAPTAAKLKLTVHRFANLDLLLPSIPISQCIVPILHIKLGLGYFLLTYILEFISTHIEWQSNSVVAAAIKLELQKAAVAKACPDCDAYKSLDPKPPGHAARLKALNGDLKVEKKVRTAMKNALKKLRTKQPSKPVEAECERILELHKIVR